MHSLFIAVAAIALPLAACGGGGGGSSNNAMAPREPQTPQTPSPNEAYEEQLRRAPGILARADSIVASTLHGTTNYSPIPVFSAPARCSGTRCTFTEPRSRLSIAITLDDIRANFLSSPATTRQVLTRSGITAMEGRATDYLGYGAGLEHSAFTLETAVERQNVQGFALRAPYRIGLAGGDLTGSRPTETATWRGLMFATPAGSTRPLQGDATLTYRLSNQPALDAAFTSISDVGRNTAYRVRSVTFSGVPVSARGTYETGRSGNLIRGGLYGPNHAEAAGVFEKSSLVGAFGSKRQ